MPKQVHSNGEKVLDVPALTAEVSRLTGAVGWWNTAILVMMVVAAMAATGLVVTQYIAFKRAEALATATGQLSNLKQHDSDQKIAAAAMTAGESNKAAGEANERAGEANESAAKAHAQVAGAMAEAAKANLELARIKLPRSLNPTQQAAVADAVSRFRGTNFAFVVFGDPKSLSLMSDIDSALHQAGWNRVSAPPIFGSDIGFNTGRSMVSQVNDVGVKVFFPADMPAMQEIMDAVALALFSEGIPCERRFSDKMRDIRPE